jgi:hypothetical protein
MMRATAAVVVAMGCLVGCASHTVSESRAKGTLAMTSFSSAPQAVVATSGRGVESRATLSAAGAFSLNLPKGDKYSLSVDVEGRRVPLAMARRSGRFDRTFKVSSDGVAIDLGAVRYRAAGAATLVIVSQSATGACDPNGSGDYECVQDGEQSSCDDGQQGNSDNGADGECVDGKDTKTNAACSDPGGDDAETADANAEMAVPERSAPTDASGCGGDGEDSKD